MQCHKIILYTLYCTKLITYMYMYVVAVVRQHTSLIQYTCSFQLSIDEGNGVSTCAHHSDIFGACIFHNLTLAANDPISYIYCMVT